MNTDLVRFALIGIAYFAANKIALLFPDAERVLAAVWPAAGVGLAALLLSPRRIWPKILALIFIAGNVANLLSGRPLVNSLFFMAANCLESFGSAWLITRWNGDEITFTRVKEIFALVCAATVVNAFSATVSSIVAAVAGIGSFRAFWITWWIADGLGLLIITPAIVAFFRPSAGTPRSHFSRTAETAIYFSAITALAFATFHHELGRMEIGNLPFLLFPMTAWGALRLNISAVAGSFLLLAVVAVTGDAVITGPLIWGGNTLQERLQIVQSFIGTIAVSGLFLSASLAESRKAVQSVREMGERFRILIEQAPEPIVLFDAGQGRLIDANPAAERLFGCSRDILLQGGPQRFYAPEQPDGRTVAESMAEGIQKVLSGEALTTLRRIHTADGRERLCEVHLIRLPSEHGDLIRGTFLDSTEQVEAQRRIAELAKRLQLATSSAGLFGVWDWNVRDNIMVWDEAMMALYGHTEQTFPGGVEAWQQGLHPEDREGTWEACQAALRGEAEWDTEFRIVRVDGEVRWIKADGEVIRDSEGQPVRMLGINRDITDDKNAETRLIERDYFLRESQRVAKIGSYKYDIGAGMWESSDVLNSIFGIDNTNSKSIEKWIEIVHPDDHDMMVRYLREDVISNKQPFNKDYRIIRQCNGEVRWVVGMGELTYDADGQAAALIGTIQDITERKRMEESLRRSEEQLLQSQKMEAVGQLAGGVAHDFNNILTVISGYCSLLQKEMTLSRTQQEKIDDIAAAAEKAAQLTHGLLAFSRKQPLIMKHENLNEIVQHVHKFLARIIGEDITLKTACSGSGLPLVADRGQIEQVLINLATNARDAMPNGGIFSVTSELFILDSSFTDLHKYDAPPGKYALLTVSDTGAGISREHLDHIFETFFTTKEVGKGTGLGMAIIYGIIRQHNGFINVYSELGQGTTFRIYLPVQETSGEHPDDKIETLPPKGGSETILVAEDDPAVRKLVSEILTSFGYETILAEDGQEAIEKFRADQDRISLVLMDMIMPKKNGKETSREIQRIKPGIRVLFSSGYTADFIENRGVSDQDIELIMKPVHPIVLLRKVREMLDA